MCTQAEADKIRKEAGLWMQRGKMFTSVDIANSLKQRGDWIKNREVAAYLRQNVLNIAPQYTQGRFDYKASTIDVTLADGSSTQAQLYHPDQDDPSAYTARSQQALSPDEAKSDNPTDAQGKSTSPFAGLAASADGIFVQSAPQHGAGFNVGVNAVKDDSRGIPLGDGLTFDEPDDDEAYTGEKEEPSPYQVGVSTLKAWKPRPSQEIHIHIDHVDNLVISTGEVEFEED